jgi:hypothetical protein
LTDTPFGLLGVTAPTCRVLTVVVNCSDSAAMVAACSSCCLRRAASSPCSCCHCWGLTTSASGQKHAARTSSAAAMWCVFVATSAPACFSGDRFCRHVLLRERGAPQHALPHGSVNTAAAHLKGLPAAASAAAGRLRLTLLRSGGRQALMPTPRPGTHAGSHHTARHTTHVSAWRTTTGRHSRLVVAGVGQLMLCLPCVW